MKKIIAGLIAVMLTCSAAALPAAECGVSFGAVTASAATVSSALSLSGDVTYSGDTVIEANVNLNGHTLTVNGDLFVTAGTFNLGGGTLNVKGDLYFQMPNTGNSETLYSTAVVNMSNANDRINVDGDFVWYIYSNVSSASTFSNGVISVKGDFTDLASGSKSSFRATNSHKLVLNGTGNQSVQLSLWSYINQFEVTNSGSRSIVGKSYLHFKSLVNDITIVPDSLTLSGAYCSGKNVTINGDVYQDGIVELQGGTMTVNGTYRALNGKMAPGGGTLNVTKNYYLRGESTSGSTVTYKDGTAYLYMSDANDRIKVDGDFIIRTSSLLSNTLTNGILTVGGNFTDSASSSKGSFKASSNHKLVLGGSGAQTVKTNSYTTINQLEIKNPSSREITYSTSYRVNSLLTDAVFVPSSLTINSFTNNGHNVTFKGDVKQACDIDVAGAKLSVTGDLSVNSGSMTLNGGTLDIGGSYKVQKETTSSGTVSYSSVSGNVTMNNAADVMKIAGDFVLRNTGTNTFSNGVLYIGGNFTDASTNGFTAASPHKTVLNGSGAQTIDLPSGKFYTLELTKSMSNYTFTQANCWVKLISPDSTAKQISDCTVTLSQSSYTYDGTAKKPTVTVKDGSTTLKSGTDYTVAYSSNTNAGTATVKITGAGDYEGTVSKTFTIAKKSASSCTVTVATPTNYFRGTRIKPVVTVKIGSTVVDPSNYTLSYTDNLMVGTAKVTVTGKNNLTGTTVQTYQIVQRSIGNCDISLSADEVYFNGARQKPAVTVSCNGTTLYSGNYIVSYTNNLSAGTATVTLTGKNNLKGTTVKTFKILARSIKNCDVVLTKNSSNPNKPNVTVKIGDYVVYSGNYTVSYSSVSNGKVTVTVTGKNNLKDTVTSTYTV